MMYALNQISDSFNFYQLLMRKHAARLKYVLQQLNDGSIDVEALKRNLEYATIVLESGFNDIERGMIEEEDDQMISGLGLSPDSVPMEVRDWLTSTFTQPNRIRPINRFRSVANALRLGIKFEKMFKLSNPRLECQIPEKIQSALIHCDTWEFDIFTLNEVSAGHALKYIGFELFNRYGFLNRFKIPVNVVDSFFTKIEAGYSKHDNPYHNLVHGADVAQATHFMICRTGLMEDIFISNGVTMNDYFCSEYAYLYNDKSVLENHHLSASFRVCQQPESSVLAGLSRDEFREFRNICIEIVLATDMSTHFAQIKQMKSMISLPENPDKVKCLSLMVHACDISHPARPWDLHWKWTHCLTEEFFRQGDLEASLGLPYSPLCDRNSVHVAESQIEMSKFHIKITDFNDPLPCDKRIEHLTNYWKSYPATPSHHLSGSLRHATISRFIDFIVEPSFQICGEMLMKVVEPVISTMLAQGLEVDDGFVDGNDNVSNRSISSRLPVTAEGKPMVPQPWTPLIASNKAEWKERAAKEKKMRENARDSAAA